ncbi:YjbH domain-containing protein [bacterium]|nr:YjbH domain-containing protein [FCB group bacterium]MBL7192306.1 YjbH domain-containing protein [bacterium]
MKRYLIIFLCLLPIIVSGQEQEYFHGRAQLKSLIDIPTAGVNAKGDYDFEIRIFHDGGILGGFAVGLFDRFSLGVYFGGTGIIGNDSDIEWNEFPGVLAKYRLIEESIFFPALAIGYSSQGYGQYMTDSTYVVESRYRIKARGLFAVFSKNYMMMNTHQMGIHFGVNKNTFETEDDKDFNIFAGIDFGLNEELFLLCEYDLALDDNSDDALGEGRGYLNMGVRWGFSDRFALQFHFKDVLSNHRDTKTIEREIRLVYIESL